MALLKFLIIFFLIVYLLSKVGGLLARLFIGNLAKQNRNQTYQYNSNPRDRQPKDGNVNIDFVPDGKTKKTSKDFKGGDYIDYEEIK